MTIFILRYVILAAVVFVVLYVVFRLVLPYRKDPNACPRCEGKGYWYDARGRERCNRCKGSGLL